MCVYLGTEHHFGKMTKFCGWWWWWVHNKVNVPDASGQFYGVFYYSKNENINKPRAQTEPSHRSWAHRPLPRTSGSKPGTHSSHTGPSLLS